MPDLSKSSHEVVFDLKDIVDMSERLNGAYSQIPYVMATLLNDGAFKTRQVLVQSTWPEHVKVRNTGFLGQALHIDKATKNNLEVAIFDKLGRAHLRAHAEGAEIYPRGQHRTIPNKDTIKLGPRGIPARQKPAAIVASTPKRALRITNRGIFVGQGGRLKLMYTLKPTTRQPADVPFYRDFQYVMNAAVRTGFADMMAKAISTMR